MDVSRPYRAVSPGLTGDVLVVLAGTTRPLTGREVARLVGTRSADGVRKALERLAEHGLVSRQRAGRSYLHALNREHVAAGLVAELAAVRSRFLADLHDEVNAWRIPTVHASLFGSAARLDGDTASDIDLFVVRSHDVDEADPEWRAQLDELAERIYQRTGNNASVFEFGENELDSLRRSARPILAELRVDRIDLAGEPLISMLGGIW